MPKVQVIFYSLYGHAYQLAMAIAEGAKGVSGTTVELLQVPEILSDDIIAKMGATDAKKAFASVPIADPKTLASADAIVLGTGTRYGSAAASMQAFLDSTGSLWQSGALIGKLGSAFTSTASQHGGQETTLVGMHTFFHHQGMLVTGVPYAAKELLTLDEVSGGTPYGATTITGAKGERMPSENELAIARFQGKHVAMLAAKLSK